MLVQETDYICKMNKGIHGEMLVYDLKFVK